MYVCMHACMHACIYIYTHILIHINIHTCISISSVLETLNNLAPPAGALGSWRSIQASGQTSPGLGMLQLRNYTGFVRFKATLVHCSGLGGSKRFVRKGPKGLGFGVFAVLSDYVVTGSVLGLCMV